MRRCHWYIKSRTGETTSVLAAVWAMIDRATSVLPVPVGMTMQPRRGRGRHPGRNGGLLLGPQGVNLDLRPANGLPGRHLVVHLDARRPQPADHRVIVDRIPAPCPDPPVPGPWGRLWCRRPACTKIAGEASAGGTPAPQDTPSSTRVPPANQRRGRLPAMLAGLSVAPRTSGGGPSNPRRAAAVEDSVAESAATADESPALADGVTVRSVTEMIFSEPGTMPNRGVWARLAVGLALALGLRRLRLRTCAVRLGACGNRRLPDASPPESIPPARGPNRSNTRDRTRGHSSRTGGSTWCSRIAASKTAAKPEPNAVRNMGHPLPRKDDNEQTPVRQDELQQESSAGNLCPIRIFPKLLSSRGCVQRHDRRKDRCRLKRAGPAQGRSGLIFSDSDYRDQQGRSRPLRESTDLRPFRTTEHGPMALLPSSLDT